MIALNVATPIPSSWMGPQTTRAEVIPAPRSIEMPAVRRLRGSEKSTLFSTQMRAPVTAINPNSTIERPPKTPVGIVWITAPNLGMKPKMMATRAAIMKTRVEKILVTA
ncbi:hypothetical protein BC936DRAFT_139403 [Jimgerdemannia flammicorona]|nr:hypothetical protein BC936DRAFT_139403 [Jimgerdemannia flammicorona]